MDWLFDNVVLFSRKANPVAHIVATENAHRFTQE